MYERFTLQAHQVLQLAKQAAQRLNHDAVGTEHILLGLIDQGAGVALNVLRNLGIELRKVLLDVEKLAEARKDIHLTGALLLGRLLIGRPLRTRQSENVTKWAMQEADGLSDYYVGPEHLLLGLMREEQGVAAQVLMSQGLRIEELREELIRLRDAGVPSSEMPSRSEYFQYLQYLHSSTDELPNAVRAAVDGLNAEIDRIVDGKLEAINAQDFQRAAVLRDEGDKLTNEKRILLRGWMAERPIDRSWLSANEGAVLKLAKSISAEYSWNLLPALADALAAVGCTDSELLGHCREASRHFDHCWVVDLLLVNASS